MFWVNIEAPVGMIGEVFRDVEEERATTIDMIMGMTDD